MVKCIRRELAMRKRVYPKRVNAGMMDEKVAEEEIEVMTAVLNFVLEKSGRREPEMF